MARMGAHLAAAGLRVHSGGPARSDNGDGDGGRQRWRHALSAGARIASHVCALLSYRNNCYLVASCGCQHSVSGSNSTFCSIDDIRYGCEALHLIHNQVLFVVEMGCRVSARCTLLTHTTNLAAALLLLLWHRESSGGGQMQRAASGKLRTGHCIS